MTDFEEWWESVVKRLECFRERRGFFFEKNDFSIGLSEKILSLHPIFGEVAQVVRASDS